MEGDLLGIDFGQSSSFQTPQKQQVNPATNVLQFQSSLKQVDFFENQQSSTPKQQSQQANQFETSFVDQQPFIQTASQPLTSESLFNVSSSSWEQQLDLAGQPAPMQQTPQPSLQSASPWEPQQSQPHFSPWEPQQPQPHYSPIPPVGQQAQQSLLQLATSHHESQQQAAPSFTRHQSPPQLPLPPSVVRHQSTPQLEQPNTSQQKAATPAANQLSSVEHPLSASPTHPPTPYNQQPLQQQPSGQPNQITHPLTSVSRPPIDHKYATDVRSVVESIWKPSQTMDEPTDPVLREIKHRFAGRWKLARSDDYDDYLKAAGVGIFARKLAIAGPVEQQIEIKGNNIHIDFHSTFSNQINVFRLNEAVETLVEKTTQSVFCSYKNGILTLLMTPLTPGMNRTQEVLRSINDHGELVTIYTCGTVTCRRYFFKLADLVSPLNIVG